MAAVKVGASGYMFFTTAATFTGVYGQAPTAGNLLVMGVELSDTVASSSSCATPSGWTAGPTGATTFSGGYKGRIILFWKVAAGGDAAPSLAGSGGAYGMGAVIEEYSGIDSAPLDVASAAGTWNAALTSGAGSLNSGSVTTTNATDFIWSFAGSMTDAVKAKTWGGGSSVGIGSYRGTYVQLDTGTQSTSATGTFTPSISWAAGGATIYGISVASIAFKQAAGGGGTAYTASPADSLGLTDTRTVTQVNARTQADALPLTDSATRVIDAARTQADALGLTDVVDAVLTAGAVDYTASPTDPLGLTDTVGSALDAARAPTDPLGLTDAVTVALDRAVTIADPLDFTDTVSWTASSTQATTDLLGLTDTVTAVLDRVVTLADLLAMTDVAVMGTTVVVPDVRYPVLALNLPQPSLALNLPEPHLELT